MWKMYPHRLHLNRRGRSSVFLEPSAFFGNGAMCSSVRLLTLSPSVNILFPQVLQINKYLITYLLCEVKKSQQVHCG